MKLLKKLRLWYWQHQHRQQKRAFAAYYYRLTMGLAADKNRRILKSKEGRDDKSSIA